MTQNQTEKPQREAFALEFEIVAIAISSVLCVSLIM